METEKLTAFEKRLCNALQNGLPIERRPFARIAQTLQSNEKMVIKTTQGFLKRGVIRRLGAVVNWRAIGKSSTLVTAHIEQDNLQKVVKAVNALEGVSHNYLRQHHFNLWFTLRGESEKEIGTILKGLLKRFSTQFYSLPVTRIFKLDVRFDAESDGRRLIARRTEDRRRKTEDTRRISEIDRRILESLQKGVKAVKRPFDFLGEDDFEVADSLLHIEAMIDEGIISRLGAVVNHHKLGFTANAMFVCRLEEIKAIIVGEKLAKLNIVSHCYQRRPFEGWPYNLFAMMHGRDLNEIRTTAEQFVKSAKIEQWELLATLEQLHKRS